jgi:hypothetical protein
MCVERVLVLMLLFCDPEPALLLAQDIILAVSLRCNEVCKLQITLD